MSYKIQSSFSAGELDPALHERTTFDKYKSGLKTGRNCYVGKTGRLISRAGQLFFKKPKYADKKFVTYSPEYSKYIIEWGHLYVRIHDITLGTYTEDAHDWLDTDLPYLQFVPSGDFVYIFCFEKKMKKMVLGVLSGVEKATRFVTDSWIFRRPTSNTGVIASGSGTGHLVEYVLTYVDANGEESAPCLPLSSATLKLPILAAEVNEVYLNFGASTTAIETRVYRRPAGGGAYGYIGSATTYSFSGVYYYMNFPDYGGAADYTHGPPAAVATIADPAGLAIPLTDFQYAYSRTGAVYQQRLLITQSQNEEAIYASRTGHQRNFYRDFPYGSDSALAFKAGTTGNARVLRIIDNEGLIVCTTVGIYVNKGPLSPDNLGLEKKGNWVIEETVPPLEVPGGILFVDKSTNAVRSLIYSNEAGGYPGEEISIFSNHLFINKKIKSWAFQGGDIPLVWVVFDDGSLISLTYQREHQMQAWTRHDSEGGLYESVSVVKSLTAKSTVYFVVKRGQERYIESGAPRFVSDIKDFVGMDCSKSFNTTLSSTAVINVLATDPADWAGLLTISSDANIFANTAGNGAIGSRFRFFDSDGSAVDLVVTTYTSAKVVVVQPSCEFPSNEATSVTLYKTFTTLTGLDHLNGKSVAVMVDGYVIASPNNDEEEYNEMVVTGGQLTLPSPGAFVHVGLPITSDVETLDIDTVEQKPTLLESMIIHKVYLKIYNTRGLFIGSAFADGNSVKGMRDVEERTERIDLGNIGNAAQKPETKRLEPVIPNEWKSQGRICLRQVDPLPFEILSIIPDLTILP